MVACTMCRYSVMLIGMLAAGGEEDESITNETLMQGVEDDDMILDN